MAVPYTPSKWQYHTQTVNEKVKNLLLFLGCTGSLLVVNLNTVFTLCITTTFRRAERCVRTVQWPSFSFLPWFWFATAQKICSKFKPCKKEGLATSRDALEKIWQLWQYRKQNKQCFLAYNIMYLCKTSALWYRLVIALQTCEKKIFQPKKNGKILSHT